MHQMLEKELDESKEKVQRLSEEDNVCMTPECISSGKSWGDFYLPSTFFYAVCP